MKAIFILISVCIWVMSAVGMGATQAECEAFWNQFVNQSVVGRYVTYVDTAKYGTTTNVSRRTTTVVESNDAMVKQHMKTTIVTTGAVYEFTTTTLREQYIEGCLKPLPTTTTLIDEGQKTIAVPAGTFDCDYQTYEVKTTQATMKSTSYFSDVFPNSQVLVKMEAESSAQTTTVSVLTDFGTTGD